MRRTPHHAQSITLEPTTVTCFRDRSQETAKGAAKHLTLEAAGKEPWHVPLSKLPIAFRKKQEFGLVLLLLLINTLNFADLAFTFMALRAGYREANPFMRGLFVQFSPVTAGLIKLGFGVAFTIVAWVLRDRKGMTFIVVAVLCVYFVLYLYHMCVTLAVV